MSKWNKRTAALTALTLLTVPTTSLAADIRVHVDGQAQHYDVAPYLKDDRTLVPLRGIFESLGANVQWDAPTATITAVKGDRSVMLRLGSRTATLNGKQVELEMAPEETNGRTMVPIRLITEALGADVKWDSTFSAVRITSAEKYDKTLNLVISREPYTLDHAQAFDTNETTLLLQTGEGLVRRDPHGALVPGVATSWTISPDGLTYTFRLRDNAKWSDSTRVTADQFEYAWTRALRPSTKSAYGFLLDNIQSVRAVDDLTLYVRLSAPQTYFVQLLAEPIFYPQKRSFVEAAGDRFGLEADKVLSNGPFQLAGWDHHNSLRLERNPHYWDRPNVALQQVNYIINSTSPVNEPLYNDGIIDRRLLTRDNPSNWDGDTRFSSIPRDGVFYINFNVRGPHVLQNAKIRKALSYAIDARSLATVVFPNISAAATGFVPTGITDDQGRDFREQGGDLIRRDLNLKTAQTLLAEGLKELGLTEFPKLKLLGSDSLLGRQETEYIRELWRKQLGIDVEVESVPFKQTLLRQMKHDYDLSTGGWQGDYNDALTFLDILTTGNGANDTGYSNADYDKLIADAKTQNDAAKRSALLHQAERMLLDDMPLAPLYFTRESSLMQPYVKGWTNYSHGARYDLKYVRIEGKK